MSCVATRPDDALADVREKLRQHEFGHLTVESALAAIVRAIHTHTPSIVSDNSQFCPHCDGDLWDPDEES